MKQLILVGNQKVKFQDTETTISLTLVADGNTVTIDKSKTYSVKIKNGTGYIKAITATPDTTNNMVTFSTSGFDGLPVDAYFIELWVIDTNGQTIYPSDSFIEVDITANATGVQGQVVPAITMQDFEDRFNTLQTDLEDKVSTLVGPTGQTGNGISTVVTQYQLSSSGSTVPTGTWSDSPVNPTDDLPYMWTRNVTTYTDKSTHTSYNISAKGTKGNNFTIQGSTSSIAGLPSTGTDGEGYMVGTELYVWTNGKWNDIVNMKGVQGDQGIQGIQGVKGDTGTGIQSTSTDYELSSQGVEVPNTGWSTTIPVTTNALPYLWTRVTITFTDSSQHVIYFTSNKGDKGDKGDTGEKGDTGANLAVKGAVDKSTSLPSTGNSEGDAYLVGTDLYVYTKGAWKDCGPIVAENTVLYNADGSINVNGTNYNYVQDLRNGKIQYNDGTKDVQVTPMDADKEASDILDARNYTDTSVSALSTNVDTKLSTKANAADLSTGLATKVTDNKDGTEQLNGVQVQPFNKLSDSVGGRNYLLNSDQPITVSEANNRYVIIPTKLKTLSAGNYIFTANVSGLVGNQTSLTIGLANPSNHNDNNVSNVPIINGTVTRKMTITDGDIHTDVIIYSGPDAWQGSAGYTAVYTNYQLIKSDIVKDWTPAPEDKVNVSDMRKPASDVAGIEEVNAKQDKIGYTPADDSKVVHSADTSNWQQQALFPKNKAYLDYTSSTVDFATLLKTKYNTPGVIYIRENNGPYWANIIDAVVICEGNSWWYSYGVTINGLFAYRKINQVSDTGWTIASDDSKVAHLSGANNFDTVPTVNNNPLLLASSLPSDLARTGQDQEFTGKNTFDTAPIDKTTGNPYITKDGVPTVDLSSYAKTSDVTTAISTATANMVHNVKGDTSWETIDGPKRFIHKPTDTEGYQFMTSEDVNSAISTATANMVNSSKPANFTAGLQSGGVDVATAADIKSVEDSAWRELTGSNDYLSYRFLYKINPDSKYLDISIGATVKKDISEDDGNILILDLATIISGISKIDSGYMYVGNSSGNFASISYTGTKIYMEVAYSRNFFSNDKIILAGKDASFAQVYYTDLV